MASLAIKAATPAGSIVNNSPVLTNNSPSDISLSKANKLGLQLRSPDPNNNQNKPKKIYREKHHASWFCPVSDGSTVKLSVSPKNENAPAPKAGDIAASERAPKSSGIEMGLTPSVQPQPSASNRIAPFSEVRKSIINAKHPLRANSPLTADDFRTLEIYRDNCANDLVTQTIDHLEKMIHIKFEGFAKRRGTTFEHEGRTYTLPRTVEFIKNPQTNTLSVFVLLNVKAEDEEHNTATDFLLDAGSSKKAKLAVNLWTAELCVRCTAWSDTGYGPNEIPILLEENGQPGSLPLYGYITYPSKKNRTAKTAIYTPYCEALYKAEVPHIAKLNAFNLQAKLNLIFPVFLCLLRLHKKKLIHRDIKPMNILLRNMLALLGDYGSTHPYTNQFYTELIGTIPFLPPETIELFEKQHPSNPGHYITSEYQIDYSRDLWGLGIVLYNVLFNAIPPCTLFLDDPLKLKLFFQQQKKAGATSLIDKPSDENSVLFLLWNLLQFDPKSRFTATEAMLKLQHIYTEHEKNKSWDVAEKEFAAILADVTSRDAKALEAFEKDDQKSS